MKSRIVLLGAPATGKGTQAAMLAAAFCLPAASTGALLREEARRGTPDGIEAARHTREGGMFPDELALRAVWSWLGGRSRFLLDGFPRTLPQAEAFDEGLRRRSLDLEVVFVLKLPEEIIRERMLGRLTCRECGGVYNAGFHGLDDAAPCPACGGSLHRREDDTEEALRVRLSEYRERTLPVVERYRGVGILTAVDATPGRDAVFQRLYREVAQ